MKITSGRRPAARGPAPSFRLEDFLPYRLSVTASRVSRLLSRKYAESYGLSIPEWRVLAMVGRFGTLSPSAVGELTAMDKVKVSRAAASLVGRGLLRQRPDPKDGRGRLLSVTRKGEAVHSGMLPLACEVEKQLADGLSRGELSALLKALDRLNARAMAVDDNSRGDDID
jgi:DNA-binding MarR family transcriptional regulator